jgi:glycosyltransferase involved in cell wall biosynthesis
MIRLCINSQTPPTRPITGRSLSPRQVWRIDRDYIPQVGGVVPMMRALVRYGRGRWIADNTRWVALGAPGLPREFRTDEGFIVETVPLDSDDRAGYVRFKEAIWRSFHGPSGLEFVPADYRAYLLYNYRTSQQLLEHVHDYDLFYIQDFQQILVGGMIGSAAPALLRWHIPLEFRGYPEPVRRFLLKSMEGFDAIVVSTRFGLEELIRYGFHGRAFQLYPYLDPSEQSAPPPGALRRFRERFGLGNSPYLLSVSRLDPVKRQDLLIQAFAQIHERFPDLRLVLAGGGSFSTARVGRKQAPTKDAAWGLYLKDLIRRLRLGSKVLLTGALSSEELRAAYEGCEVFVHPAPWEGFGLVVVEAWFHRRPIIVSRGAGIAELVNDEANGFTVPSGSVRALASRIRWLLERPEAALRLGEAGYFTSRQCHVRRGAGRLREIFTRAIEIYSQTGGTARAA